MFSHTIKFENVVGYWMSRPSSATGYTRAVFSWVSRQNPLGIENESFPRSIVAFLTKKKCTVVPVLNTLFSWDLNNSVLRQYNNCLSRNLRHNPYMNHSPCVKLVVISILLLVYFFEECELSDCIKLAVKWFPWSFV